MEIPYRARRGRRSFTPSGPDRATARIELNRTPEVVEVASGIRGFKLLRLGGSSFHGFVRDQYTTLPDIPIARCTCGLIWSGFIRNRRPPSALARLPHGSRDGPRRLSKL